MDLFRMFFSISDCRTTTYFVNNVWNVVQILTRIMENFNNTPLSDSLIGELILKWV